MKGFTGDMARIGYARVSTVDQHLDLQKNALLSAGCTRLFEDHGVSGGEEQRDGLSSMLKTLRRGDILVVWRLDRLGRSVTHLITLVETLKRRGIAFASLTEAIDTTSAGGQLIFHILAALAQFEKSLIRERTIAGIAAARARGKRPGRRPSLTDGQCREIRDALADGACLHDIATVYEVHPRTVLRGVERVTVSDALAA